MNLRYLHPAVSIVGRKELRREEFYVSYRVVKTEKHIRSGARKLVGVLHQ